MNTLNSVMRGAAGLVFAPMLALPPWLPLVILSAAFGVLAALVFRYTSNQAALRRVADKMGASLLALRLYKDDTVVTFRAIGGLFTASMARLWYSLVPLLIMIVPFVLILAQMAMYYEFRPLRSGQTVLLEVRILPDKWGEYSDLELVAPTGIDVQARVRDQNASTITWRIEPNSAVGNDELSLRLGGQDVARKQIVVAENPDRLAFVSPMRARPNIWEPLLYPGEDAFSAGDPIQRVAISYDTRQTPILGIDMHWLISFLILSIIAALLAKPWLKVQF